MIWYIYIYTCLYRCLELNNIHVQTYVCVAACCSVLNCMLTEEIQKHPLIRAEMEEKALLLFHVPYICIYVYVHIHRYVLLLVHVPSRLVDKTSSMQEVPLCIASGQIWSAPHHTATHCNTLHNTATRRNTLQRTARQIWSARLSCCALLCIATCCSVMQCVAVCCTVVQCVALLCSVLQCVAVWCSVV